MSCVTLLPDVLESADTQTSGTACIRPGNELRERKHAMKADGAYEISHELKRGIFGTYKGRQSPVCQPATHIDGQEIGLVLNPILGMAPSHTRVANTYSASGTFGRSLTLCTLTMRCGAIGCLSLLERIKRLPGSLHNKLPSSLSFEFNLDEQERKSTEELNEVG